VEEEVKALIPGIRVARIDADTITSPGFQKGILQGFRKGEYDVLVGTQMIARGLDFPGFSLIGVVSADTGLNLPDFRAAEKTFQLLTQLISRVRPEVNLGEVIIQTYNPEHYSIQCACNHDYNRFYSQEMKFRQQLGYPPYRHLISILIQGNSDAETFRWAMNLGKFLTPVPKGNSGIEMLGPTPAPFYRRQGKFRWQILLLGENEIILKDFCRENIISWKHPSPIRISLDVDPIELM
jgi:primosomal protein N' (replication factor Y)